jgi:zinc protease
MHQKAGIRIIVSCLIVFMCSICILISPLRQTTVAGDEDPIGKYVGSLEETPFVTKAVLKNGMTVLINENHDYPVLSMQAFVKAGIFDEPDDSPGLSSLLAEIVYREKSDETAGTPLENARMLGGFLTSSIGCRNARFEIAAPAPQWKKALQVQSEALLNDTFDPAEVKQAAGLILEEARERLENPSVSAYEALLGLGFGSTRMEPWTSVLKGDLESVPYEKLAGFYKKMVVPERMMLVISGDVNAFEVLNEAARLYGNLPATGRRGSAMPVSLSQEGFRFRGMQGDARDSHLLLGFHTPGAESRDYPALEVLSAVVGLGNGSILAARLRDQKNLIYEGETELSVHPEFGYLTIHVKISPEAVDRCEIAVFTELELLKRKGPDAADMERAWAQLERTYRNRIETASGRAQMLAQFESWGDWKRMDRHISEIRQVRADDVKRVAQKYLRMENCSLVEFLPNAVDNRSRTVESIGNTLKGLLNPAAAQEQNSRERETVLAVEIPEGDDSYKFSRVQYPFQIASVLRGPEIYIREDHTTPLIHIGLFFPGGRLAETERNSGITRLMVRMMLRGSQKKSAYRFNRQLEIYGGQLQPVVEDDYFGFYFSILSKNFHAGFNLFMEAVKTPVFDGEAIERQKALIEADRGQYKDWKETIEAAIYPKLFNASPYSRDASGTEESLQGITPESLKDWYDGHIRNRKPVVVIIGDSEGTSLASYFVREFSGSRFQETEITEEFAGALEKNETINKSWDKNRSLVSIGFQAPPAGDTDRYPAVVLQSYLGKSGRMVREIQKRLGIARKVCVSYKPMLRGGSFVAYAVVSPGREDAALEALEREFRHAVTGPYSYRDYRSAVNAAVGDFQLNQQVPFLQITGVARNIMSGEGIEGYRSSLALLQAVLEEDLKNAAERIFRTERAVSLRIYGNKPLDGDSSKAE